MTPQTILIIIILIIVFDFFLERFLDYLNSKCWSKELPSVLNGIYDKEKYKKAMEYDRTKSNFSIVSSVVSFIMIIAMLVFNGFAFVDDLARIFSESPIFVALIFFGMIGLASDLLGTPFSVYGTFVIEEKYGFNRTNPLTFILDKIKSWFLAIIIGGGLLALVVWIYEVTGEWFWLYVWIVISAFMLVMTMFYSNIIVPLFNKQSPLDEGELRKAIEAFSLKVGFKLDNIFVIDGSKRSSKANAYFTGLGSKKRIVLYDTLIKQHTVEELVAVLAHEIGHYKKKHTLIGLIISILQTGLMLFVLSLFIQKDSTINEILSNALGASTPSFHIGVLAFGLLYSPLSLLLGIALNIVSRKNEYAADRFVKENYSSKFMQEALKKLSVNNLSNLTPHPAYVFFYYSHPPLLERLKYLDKTQIK